MPSASDASTNALQSAARATLDKQLDDSPCEKLEEHLDGCEPCKAFLESLEATITQLRELPSETLNRVEGAKIRKNVLSRYRILLTKNADADRRV